MQQALCEDTVPRAANAARGSLMSPVHSSRLLASAAALYASVTFCQMPCTTGGLTGCSLHAPPALLLAPMHAMSFTLSKPVLGRSGTVENIRGSHRSMRCAYAQKSLHFKPVTTYAYAHAATRFTTGVIDPEFCASKTPRGSLNL